MESESGENRKTSTWTIMLFIYYVVGGLATLSFLSLDDMPVWLGDWWKTGRPQLTALNAWFSGTMYVIVYSYPTLVAFSVRRKPRSLEDRLIWAAYASLSWAVLIVPIAAFWQATVKILCDHAVLGLLSLLWAFATFWLVFLPINSRYEERLRKRKRAEDCSSCSWFVGTYMAIGDIKWEGRCELIESVEKEHRGRLKAYPEVTRDKAVDCRWHTDKLGR
jgi:hypothetical protein